MTQPSNTIVYYTEDLTKCLNLAYENSAYAKYAGSTTVYADRGLTLPIGVVCLNLGVYKNAKKQILFSSVSFDGTTTTIKGDLAHNLTLKNGEVLWIGGTNTSCSTGNFTDAVGLATGKKLKSGKAYKFDVVYEGYYNFTRR